jgi:Uma2 family endonuclease
VLCGDPQLDPEDPKGHTVLSPKVLVEVTSHSTEEYDRGDKFDLHYAQIPSLAEYVLVSHRERAIEVRRRAPNGEWSTLVARSTEQVRLESLGVTLDVDSLYEAALGEGRPR